MGLLATAVAGCCPREWKGFDEQTGEHLVLHPESMPADGHFAGAWWSAQVGAFVLRDTAPGEVEGDLQWNEPPACTVQRHLSGKSDGNHLSLTFTDTFQPATCGADALGTGDAFLRVTHGTQRLFGHFDTGGQSAVFTAYVRSP